MLSVCQDITYSPWMASGGWGYSGSGGHPENPIAFRQSPQDSASHRCISVGTRKCGSKWLSHAFFHILTSSGAYNLLSVKPST